MLRVWAGATQTTGPALATPNWETGWGPYFPHLQNEKILGAGL